MALKLTNIVRKYFFFFTSKKAFGLFFFFIVFGFIAMRIMPPTRSILITVGLVVLYGCVLLYAQNKNHIDLSVQTKNSPYFMGFIFFLISLSFIFIQNLSGDSVKLNMSLLFTRAGIAVLTTLFGLIFRQALFSFDPTEAQTEVFVQELSEDLKKSAKLYRDAQTRLFNLVEEFTAAKEILYRREESISSNYTSSLHNAIVAYSGIVDKLKSLMDTNITEVSKSFDQFKDNIVKTLANLNETVDFTQEKMKQSLAHSLDNLTKGLAPLSSRQFEEIHESYINSLRTSTQLISNIQTKYAGELSANIEIFQKNVLESTSLMGNTSESFALTHEKIVNKMEALSPAVAKIAETINNLNSSYDRISDSVIRQSERFDLGLRQRLTQFEEELNTINTVMENFLELLNKNVQAH